jgi:Reverse transcriptase (RNA-dependent DNA polymerase)/RNase H-like domain found in reverse transcriptase
LPHGAPVLFVCNKDSLLQLWVDFRGFNKISKKDRYPLPLIADLLDAPKKAHIYTKIELRHAFHLVRVAEGDKWKTAFRTRYGSFEWMVMLFGLTNGPAVFQHFMNKIFTDLLDVCVVVYLDDILIYSNNPSLHQDRVTEVLWCLRQHNLFAREDKCEFHRTLVEFLGYSLLPEGLTMSDEKVKAIQDWPKPRKVHDIQSFLGFANFYLRFIHDYSRITIPLTRLTRKGTPWHFSDECRRAFDTLKKAFTTAPVLTHWIPDAPLIVETDASDYALVAILSLRTSDGELHLVAFHSRTFTLPELNYDVHDKELLGIFEAFPHWQYYLEGSADPIDVVTDHKNLE